MRVLLVEDNERLSNLLFAGLSKEGFEVDLASSISEGLTALATTHFAAVVLDLGLPDGDGLAVVQSLRDRGNPTPVLVLTARSKVSDKVKGLQWGADDYLGKPFAFEELVARLRALLRRPGAFLGDVLRLGRLSFDTAAREIIIDDKRDPISPREAAVLETLLRRSGRVVPKTVIEDQLYGFSGDGSANAVEVYIHRLRKKLNELGANVEIHTIRGVGYLIKEEKR